MRRAVIDIGTRSTKIVVGDTSLLMSRPFSWDLFRSPHGFRKGWRNGVSDAIDAARRIDCRRLDTFIETLRECTLIAKQHKVAPEHVTAFVTGALRGACNRDEFLAWVKEETGLAARVLPGTAEGQWTLLSALASLDGLEGRPVVVIDQGGGSTEVTAGITDDGDLEVLSIDSLPLGTVGLERLCQEQLPDATPRDVHAFVSDYVARFIAERYRPSRTGRGEWCVVGEGASLNKLAAGTFNREQHGRVYTAEQIRTTVLARVIDHEKYRTRRIGDLLLERQVINRETQAAGTNEVDNALAILVGTPIVLELLRAHGADRIILNGTGLRFGVLFALSNDPEALDRA